MHPHPQGGNFFRHNLQRKFVSAPPELIIHLTALIIAFLAQMLQISTKSTARFLSNSFLKMELKNRIFPYGKYSLAYLLQEVL